MALKRRLKQVGICNISLERVFFPLFRILITGLHDLLRRKPSFLFMLSGWRSICTAFLIKHSTCPDFLAKILVS